MFTGLGRAADEGHLTALVRTDLGTLGEGVDWDALTESRTLGVTDQFIQRALDHHDHIRRVRPQEHP